MEQGNEQKKKGGEKKLKAGNGKENAMEKYTVSYET
jgi:hypothetical protein